MAHKYEHVSTGNGFSVYDETTKTKTQVINQDGTLNGTAVIDDASVTNAKLAVPNIKVISETLTLADFTDNDDTTGTAELSTDIPKGAVVMRTLIDDVTGFIGDTSATVTIGDGTDVDRYNTGTPNVFADADTIDAGAVSGTIYHSAAKTPTVIVTTDSDFSSVTAGGLKVSIFYYQGA
jgi:hypothetical protein